MSNEKLRVKWSIFVDFDDVAKAAPSGYERAEDGADKAPGTYGKGFGGEPVVCLLSGDDGAWFDKLAARREREHKARAKETEA